MKITESVLRRLIKEEYSHMLESDDSAKQKIVAYYASPAKTQEELTIKNKQLASDLKACGVVGSEKIAAELEKAGHGDDSALSFAEELAKLQTLNERRLRALARK